jgi:hypothetical protein
MQGDTDTITAEIENLLRSGKISITEGGKVEINE